MIVMVDDNTQIEAADGVNFTVKLRRAAKNKETGKVELRWHAETFHASLTAAALSVLQRGIRNIDGEIAIRDLITELREASERIADACVKAPDRLKDRVLPDDLPQLQALIERATAERSKRRKRV